MTSPDKTPNYGFDLIPDRFRGWGGMYRSMVTFLDSKLKLLTDGLDDKAGAAELNTLSGTVGGLSGAVDALDDAVGSLAGQVASKLSAVVIGTGLLGNGTSGNPLKLDPSAIPAPTGGGMTAVAHDGTLTGDGTSSNPLKVNPAIIPAPPATFTVVETSSDAWTVLNPGVLPRDAEVYINPPAGRWATPVGVSGLSSGDLASPGFMGKPTVVRRRLPDSDTVQTPTDAIKVSWIDFGPSTPASNRYAALNVSGSLYVSSMGGAQGNNYLDSLPVTRPGGLAAGATMRISGQVTGSIGSAGGPSMTVTINNGGAKTVLGSTPNNGTPYTQTNNFSFDVAVPPAGNWTLELEYPLRSAQLSSETDAGVQYNVLVEYIGS